MSLATSPDSLEVDVSQNIGTAASPVFVGLTLSGLTAGSVLFAGTGGLVSQDNANLFWDDTNNRLGIGTATPQVTLEVVQSANSSASRIVNTNASFSASALKVGTIKAAGTDFYLFFASTETDVHGVGGTQQFFVRGDGTVAMGLFGTSGAAADTPGLCLGTSSAFRQYNSRTDASNGDWFETVWATNVLTLGTNKNGTGSARALVLATGGVAALTIGATQIATFAGAVVVPGVTTAALTSTGTFTSGAGAQVGTITNSPLAGNPTSWIKIVDNGTTRYIPAW